MGQNNLNEEGLKLVMKNNEIDNRPILIGNTLKNIRKSLGLTQEEAAESLSLAPRYLSDIERDKTKGSLTTLIKLCNLYNVTPTFILKDYLSNANFELDDGLVGYYNLNDKEKIIIKKLIQFMNQNKS